MQPALAFAPIAAILALMLGARWSAAHAGLAGLALTLLIALMGFGYGEGARGGGGQHRLPAQHHRRRRHGRTALACVLNATAGGLLVWLQLAASRA